MTKTHRNVRSDSGGARRKTSGRQPSIMLRGAKTLAWGVTLAAGASLAVAAPTSISGSGAVTCPNMPTLNPNPPSKTGATDIINFAKDSLIIPMDNCYQRANFPSDTMVQIALAETYGTLDVSGALTLGTTTVTQALCESSSRGDTGQLEAYAVIQRLVEDGIPVHWALKADKRAWAQADFSVVGGTGAPVKLMAYDTAVGSETDAYSTLSPKTISYSGAPFVIDADHAADARTLIAGYGSDFANVAYHVAQTSFDAPIFKSIGGMPSMAVVDLSGYFTRQKTSELKAAIGIIGMDASEGDWWRYLTASDVKGGALLAGDSYDLVWVPSFGINSPGGTSTDERDVILALEAYAAAGGSIVFQDEAAAALEGDGTFDTSGSGSYSSASASATTRISTSMAHSGGGLIPNLSSSSYGGNSATELVESDDYSDPASQWGGAAWIGTGGAKTDWTPRCDTGYRDGVRRMIYTKDLSGSTLNNIDFATWRHYGGDETLGRTYYLGGYNMDKNRQPIFRLLMNTVMVSAGDYVAPFKAEVGRSAPIVATVSGVEGQYTGTFDANFPPVPATVYTTAATANAFFFPDNTGHVRALNTAELATGNTSLGSGVFDPADANYNANLVLFDAADVVGAMSVQTNSPCAIGGSCRHIFTNDGATKVTLTEDNLDNFKDEFGLAASADDADKLALMKLVHAGADDGASGRIPALGGVDRSTMALIEESPIIGVSRPTVAYVGGLDGMMHAICADTVAPCTTLGQELWAFLPRSELSKIATNETRLDGSPKVADVFADFGSGKEYKTVLTFQTGNESPSAVYALDVTDPSDPAVLWQNTTPGAGTNTAMAVIHVQGKGLVSATFVQTASGTTTPGMYLAALDSASGEVLWSQTLDYPNARDSANSNVPASGFPGGVSVFASDGGDIADTVLAPSLWGAVFAFEAKDGVNQNASSPLFQFSSDFHPIGAPVSVYRDQSDGLLKGVIASGGFTDSFSPTSTLWAPDSINQYAISFPIVDVTTVPILDTDVRDDSTLGVYIDLGAGNRAFSQPTIIGNEIFLTTDSADVNASVFGSGGNTGTLVRISLGSGAVTRTSIPSGAASVDVSSTSNAVYAGGGNSVQKTDITGYDANGATVETSEAASATRSLWLRTQ